MRALFIVAICTVYSAQASFVEDLGALHIETKTGQIPPKHAPTPDDKKATRKALAFMNFIKVVPQLNPVKRTNSGPYHFQLSGLDLSGDVQLHSIVVSGIKNLGLQKLNLQVSPNVIEFNATLPEVDAEVAFTLNAHLGNNPISVSGSVNAKLKGLVVLGTVGTTIKTVTSYPIYVVDAGVIVIDLNNLTVTVSLSKYEDTFKTVLKHFAQNLRQYSNIVDDILKAVLKAITNELAIVPAKEILQYLVGPSAQTYLG